MKENQSSLWSPNEELRSKSKLELFCRDLDKKKILKYNQNFKNIDIDLRKFSTMYFHDFYVAFEVRILIVFWVWFLDEFV